MLFKTYTPKEIPDVIAIQWTKDNFEEVKEFLGKQLIEERFLFNRPISDRVKKLIHTTYFKCCDNEGRNEVIYCPLSYNVNRDSSCYNYAYYGDFFYKTSAKSNCVLACSSVSFFSKYKEK